MYGTLRKGQRNPYAKVLAENAKYLGMGRIRAKLYQLVGYPGAKPSRSGKDVVEGEIFSFRKGSGILKLLDKYEGHVPGDARSEFMRKRALVRREGRKTIRAWVYFFNGRK